MAREQGYSPAAAAYAQALIELAADPAEAQRMGIDLASLAQSVASESVIKTFFSDPSISPGERWPAIQATFHGKSSAVFVNFLGVLNEKNRLPLIPEISAAYRDMLDRLQNRVRVEVTVAQKLDDAATKIVQERISSALGKTAIIEEKVDEKIIGGLVLRVHDKLIDASVKAQLEAMRRQLLSVPVAG